MIECLCINDSNKPESIPGSHWVKRHKKYHVVMIYNMVKQEGILGVALKEIDLDSLDIEYNSFKISRFAFRPEDMDKLAQMAKDCKDLDGFDVEELINEQIEVELL